MEGTPTGFWGKLKEEKDATGRRRILAWHPLADHCADVAAVCEALLQRTLLRRRLARVGGRDDLNEVQVARLCVLAALHDAGKLNVGFQVKALEKPPPFRCGHMAEFLGLFRDVKRFERTVEALALDQIETWGKDMFALLVATICHHGRPVQHRCTLQSRWWDDNPGLGLRPFQGLEDLVRRTRRWFPEAWHAERTEKVPSNAEFQHAWSGLVTLADWLGSTEDFFPFSDEEGDRMPASRAYARRAVEKLGLEADLLRGVLGKSPPGYERISEFEPRPAQERMLELSAGDAGSLTVLEAATGSGKTEAALLHFVRLYHAGLVDGLYFALPTRTAATQIYRRVFKAVERAFPDREARPPVVQAVPGYISVDEVEGERLAHFRVLWNDKERFRYRGWAGEHPKRFLAGAVVVGTVDQVLLSALMVSHAHMRSTALLRQLLVVDEVHASDVYMTRLLEAVLEHHLAAGGHVLLMSATLGSVARARFLSVATAAKAVQPAVEEAIREPYPAVSFRRGEEPVQVLEVTENAEPKRVGLEILSWADDPARIAGKALAAAAEGARVLVVRNTVAGCRDVQVALEELAAERRREDLLFAVAGKPAPHHGRYARADRILLDGAIEKAFGKTRPRGGCVAVATQTVEQSLDLDADLLLSDLCPIDVLLQRIGRLHRHERERPRGFETARVVVLGPDEPLESMIDEEGQGRGRHGLGTVYADLRSLEATRRIVEANPEVAIPRDNRRLVEEGTHPAVLERLAEDLGGAWPVHVRYLLGRVFAERRQARFNMIDRNREFGLESGSFRFPEGDEARRIPTRLGEQDRLVRFAQPVTSPFGAEVTELAIAAHLLGSEAPSVEESNDVRVEVGAEGFTFRFGKRTFEYGRLGLAVL